ncbi:MAG: hypothetical protein AB1633_02875, partial [Elusimicrobiota bacterium]
MLNEMKSASGGSKKAILSFIAVCGIVVSMVLFFTVDNVFAYPGETITTISSASARGANNANGLPLNIPYIVGTTEYYVISGTVTATPNLLVSKAFFIQDGTGGAYVYGGSTVGISGLNIQYGDVLTVSGFVTQYNGSTELTWF